MTTPFTDLNTVIKTMKPVLNSGIVVFCVVALEMDISNLPSIATIREKEGMTVVLPEETATTLKLPVLFRSAWITLSVQSDLALVGLTAAVSKALTEENISCNIIAGAFHDHLFVPYEMRNHAMKALLKLQATQF